MTMRLLATVLGLAVLAVGAPALAADQIIKLSECEALDPEHLRELAEYALTKRRYNIEENTQALLVGEQDDLRVEILIEPMQMVIRWKEGFGHKKDQWLRNLKTDVLWRLAE
jgi:hypothetical protein